MTRSNERRSATASSRTSRTARKPRKNWRTAATSDKYELYELSVQNTEAECDFIDQAWKEQRRRTPHHIREDFCGTAAVCMEWVKRRRTNTAVGVDLDPEVLAWGRNKMPERLTPAQAKRVTLLQADVRSVKTKPVDTVLAMNFSYFFFKTRDMLRRYFKAVRRGLVSDGIFILDCYGGSESFLEMEEDRNLDGFTYIWDQSYYNPITGDAVNHIHFEFPDGTSMRKAFTYEWRLWTIPEIREVLLEAGFKKVLVYWEGTNRRTGEGNGIWSVSERGEACLGWIAYLVALK